VIAADDDHKRELVLRHLSLARRLARRYAGSGHASDDVTQVAYLGLVKAVDRFDPERGVSFASFAIPTILGELKRHFRDTRWVLHVPRHLKERSLRVEREQDELTRELGRMPKPRELARRTGLSVEEVLVARDASRGLDARSLDAPADVADGADSCLLELLGSCDPGYELVDEVASVAPAFAELDERARLVLSLRFHEELSQKEIGHRIGVSQMQVSRIISRSLDKVRDALTAPELV
jgi:RNA polymerase sigma-B factor